MAEEIGPNVRFLSELIVTDTRVWEIVKRTPETMTLRTTRQGEVLRREDRDRSGYPQVWTEALSDPSGPTRIVRKRKDGTYRIGTYPLFPTQLIDGKPVSYTDYRF